MVRCPGDGCLRVPDGATDEQLVLVHAEEYVQAVSEGALSDIQVRRIGFPWSPELVERSRRSVGATIAASTLALDEGVAVNLAGGTHHASHDAGQGYCVFNDSAVAIRVLQRAARVHKAIVIDCDVHHGNGTSSLFATDDSVYTFSIHSAKCFPAKKPPGDRDIPLAAGTGGTDYLDALRVALSSIDAKQFDIAIYLAGADPYEGDSLGDLELTASDLGVRDSVVMDWCEAARLPLCVTMAGGYAHDVGAIVDIHESTVRAASELRARLASGS